MAIYHIVIKMIRIRLIPTLEGVQDTVYFLTHEGLLPPEK